METGVTTECLSRKPGRKPRRKMELVVKQSPQKERYTELRTMKMTKEEFNGLPKSKDSGPNFLEISDPGTRFIPSGFDPSKGPPVVGQIALGSDLIHYSWMGPKPRAERGVNLFRVQFT